MSSGYTVNGVDLDNIFLPRTFTTPASNSGYLVGSQDLSSRYEASRDTTDRSFTVTGLKTANGSDINTLYMSNNTVIVPQYSINANQTTINETTNRTVRFDVVTVDVAPGTTLYWSIDRTDLSPNSGSIVISEFGSANFSTTASTDATAEGYVTFQAILRTGSQSGPEVRRSNAIGLIDSSIPIPTYAITPNKTAINETTDRSVTFNVTTTNVNPGTTLYWTLSRTDLTPNSGSFIVSNNNSFAVTTNADNLTEGYTTFTASLRTGSTSGGILITSSAVGINDTSTTPITYPDTLTFDIRQFAGDCWRLYVSGSKRLDYRVVCSNSANNGTSKKDRSFTFNPTIDSSLPRVSLNDQGWNGNRFNIETISLLNTRLTETMKTWDIQKSFYTGSNIDGSTTAKFTITNLTDTTAPNSVYTLSSNAVASGTAKAVFTVGVS